MMIYGFKDLNADTSLTPHLCMAAGGTYCSGLIWLLIGREQDWALEGLELDSVSDWLRGTHLE